MSHADLTKRLRVVIEADPAATTDLRFEAADALEASDASIADADEARRIAQAALETAINRIAELEREIEEVHVAEGYAIAENITGERDTLYGYVTTLRAMLVLACGSGWGSRKPSRELRAAISDALSETGPAAAERDRALMIEGAEAMKEAVDKARQEAPHRLDIKAVRHIGPAAVVDALLREKGGAA